MKWLNYQWIIVLRWILKVDSNCFYDCYYRLWERLVDVRKQFCHIMKRGYSVNIQSFAEGRVSLNMKLKVYISSYYDVFYNLAQEDALIKMQLDKNEIILFLWQNDPTVVIGRNQNIVAECNLRYLSENGIKVARRVSGGGAVYHDRGNLNYTFISPNNQYDKKKFMTVVIKAFNSCGLDATLSGRNDVLIQGKKISGVSYYVGERNSLMHGCILVNSDLAVLENVLTVSESKIKSKGIQSVRSRVSNVTDFDDAVDVDIIRKALIEEFINEYDCYTECILSSEDINISEEVIEKFRDDNWIFRRNIFADITLRQRFEWGECTIILKLSGKKIEEAVLYSDGLMVDVFDRISLCLEGCDLMNMEIKFRLDKLKREVHDELQVISDIEGLLIDGLEKNRAI